MKIDKLDALEIP